MRPLLKGILHICAAFASPFLFTVYKPTTLHENIRDEVLWYFSMVYLHFLCSAALHLGEWKGRTLKNVRVIDHICIYLLILHTYRVYLATVISSPSASLLLLLYGGVIMGIISRVLYTDTHPIYIGLPYLVTSLSIFIDKSSYLQLYQNIPYGVVWMNAGGWAYIIGAGFYMLRPEMPGKLSRYISFHEIFHLLSVIGTGCFIHSIVNYAIPYYEGKQLSQT